MNREVARLFLNNLLMEFAKRIIQMMHRHYISNQPFSDSELKGWVSEYTDKILSNARTD